MSLYRRSNARKPAWVVLTALVGGMLVILSTYTHLGVVARGYAASGVAAVTRVTDSFTAPSRTLRAENSALRIENNSLHEQLLENASLADENARLRALLSVADHSRTITTARVATRPGFSPYGTFVIRAGSEDGIVPGMLVVAEGAVAIGTVTNVGDTTATVSLFSAPGKELDARLQDSTLVTYVGAGNGSGEAIIPRGLSIAEHAPVFLPGTSYLLGVVAAITGTPEDPSLHLSIAPPISFAALEYVSIVPAP